MLIFLLATIIALLVAFFVAPLLCLFFEVVADWWEHWFDRLETAAVRFSRGRGWR